MHENICLQCKEVSSGPSNRLVQDSCGHKKCRTCLFEDEEQCKQCEEENGTDNDFECENVNNEVITNVNGEIHNLVLNNHTAVIQVNGGVTSSANATETPRIIDVIENYVESSENHDFDSNKNCLKPENEDDNLFRIKKPDKKKKSHSPVDIPKHISVISDPPSYHCTICDKTFITKTHVKYHSYCAGAVKPYKCDVCQKEFILRAQLDVHSYKHKSNKPFSCSICKKSFTARNKLTRHAVVHSTVKSHICSVCGNAYRSKESLKIHSIIHKGEKPYGCKLCSAKFSNRSNLNKHVGTHSKEKAHMCDQCGKRFKQKWALSVHRKSHLRIRPHECAVCNKTFVNLKDLQRHNLIHTDIKAYSCSICGLEFRRTDNLRRHMKNTHPGKNGQMIKTKGPKVLPTAHKDNPNAINVITSATSACNNSKAEGHQQQQPAKAVVLPSRSDCRPNSRGATTTTRTSQGVINGPIKLAFKTPAFKSSYNIHRDFNYVPPPQHKSSYDMVESVNICQKILSVSSSRDSPPPGNIICHAESREPTSEEICQKILDPNSEPKIHYETSFQNRKHAMIKNIKFKVPIQYTRHFIESNMENNTNVESVAATSVIVNNSVQCTNMEHWRRRTSQNLGLRN